MSCQDRMSIATSVERRMTTLDRMLEAVSVMTACTPPTSLEMRDWISPVLVLVKKPKRHVLQVDVERVAEVLHHTLPDHVGQVGLPDAQGPRGDRDHDHQGHQEDQKLEVGTARNEQGPVEDDLDEQGIDDAEGGRPG